MYKIKVKNVPQNILDEIGGIRIVMGGSYATFDYEMDAVEDADLIEKIAILTFWNKNVRNVLHPALSVIDHKQKIKIF